ncbi:toxin-antitoxin system YwqK family antitoxin [Pontibacter arcticus]|uniref:MORN repeat variant n=1 Tax=Pontibacter arcticus TaxID=2080288 RepID=A0A364RG59_9BACT|nr:hypothetical protein [Pontibacter arcticus]RAU83328.1 hypothetical protein DP923_08970 [Pontibacter arcticus]
MAQSDKAVKSPAKGIWPFRYNKLDKQGNYHGRWKLYGPDEKTLIRNGRFRHGAEIGKWRYYYLSGQLMMLEYHNRKRADFTVKRYHKNGALEKQGQARWVDEGKLIRYYWFGLWDIFNEQGQLTHQEYYEKGKQVELQPAN